MFTYIELHNLQDICNKQRDKIQRDGEMQSITEFR
jgi:hypothetical protein